MLLALLPLIAYTPGPITSLHTSRSAVLRMKQAPAEEKPEVVLPNIGKGSICEFHDPKHGAGACPPVLGVVTGVEAKAKGGARVLLVDADDNKHSVTEKSIHIILPPFKGKSTEPSEILADYSQVLELESTELGVDPELLELAWSECAESEKKEFSPKAILTTIDDSLCKTPLDLYKAFRIMSSDLGKVFFKGLGHNKFKAKAMKAVKASKDNWCRAPEHEDPEFCFCLSAPICLGG
jgi:hypothetical protein